jgi:hypothetical protein
MVISWHGKFYLNKAINEICTHSNALITKMFLQRIALSNYLLGSFSLSRLKHKKELNLLGCFLVPFFIVSL